MTVHLSRQEVVNVHEFLAEAAGEREAKLDGYNDTTDLSDTYDDNGSDSPTFDVFYGRGGSKAITGMKHLDPMEFMKL